jgi:monoamine oxidase
VKFLFKSKKEIIKPESRIHFRGGHASLYLAWIRGAFKSGLRAAIAIYQAN